MTAMKLTAAEFKGQMPPGTDNISDSKMLMGLRKLQAIQSTDTRSKYLFQVIPYFSFSSWLADTVKNNPELLARVLNHEQSHYDIHLLMAAELKKQLSETYFDRREYARGILDIRDKLSREELKINQLYQAETNYGRNTGRQKEWDTLIDKAMQAKSWAVLMQYASGKI